MKVRRVAINPGYADLRGVMRTLARPDVDVLVIGETREWEGILYAQDAIAAGNAEGTHRTGTRHLRGERHERMCPLAEDVHQRSAGGVHSRRRAVLESASIGPAYAVSTTRKTLPRHRLRCRPRKHHRRRAGPGDALRLSGQERIAGDLRQHHQEQPRCRHLRRRAGALLHRRARPFRPRHSDRPLALRQDGRAEPDARRGDGQCKVRPHDRQDERYRRSAGADPQCALRAGRSERRRRC